MMNRTFKLKKSKLKHFWYCFLAFFVIYSTDSLAIELSLYDLLRDMSYLALIGVGVVFGGLILLKNHGKLRGTDAAWLAVLIVSVFFSSVMNFDKTFVGPIKIGCLLIGYYIAREMDTELFIRYFLKVMMIISVYSLISFLLSPVLIKSGIFPIVTGYKGQEFQLQFLSNIRIYPSSFRNWGPFWEPGAYQTYLIIALMLVFFGPAEMKYKKTQIAVFTATLVSTFSTTGYIAFPFIFLAYLIDADYFNKNLIWKLVLLTSVAFAVIWFVNSEFFATVFVDKFDDDVINHRAVTVQYGIPLLLQKPLFGFSSKYVEAFYNLSGFYFGITNFFMANAVCYGLAVGLYSIIGLVACVKSLNRPFLVSLLVFAGLFLSLCGEKYLYSPMICFLLFYRKQARTRHCR